MNPRRTTERVEKPDGRCPVCRSPDVPPTVRLTDDVNVCVSCDKGLRANDRNTRKTFIARDIIRPRG